MRVMIPLSGPGLNFPLDPRFGRAPFVAIVDTENPSQPEVFPNPYALYPSAAGIAVAQLALQKGVQAVVAPAVGPNASMVLLSAGVRIIPFAGFTGKETIKRLGEGEIPSVNFPFTGFPSEEDYIKSQISVLESQLNNLKRRLEDLEKRKKEET